MSKTALQNLSNDEAVHLLIEADRRGDEETASELRRVVTYPAEALLSAKRNMGADWIRKQGFRTETAEAKYGQDWLDREI